LHEEPTVTGRSIHLCLGEGNETSPREIADSLLRMFRYGAARTLTFVPPDSDMNGTKAVMHAVHAIPFLSYLDTNPRFCMESSSQVLAERAPRFATYGDRLFAYCRDSDWGR